MDQRGNDTAIRFGEFPLPRQVFLIKMDAVGTGISRHKDWNKPYGCQTEKAWTNLMAAKQNRLGISLMPAKLHFWRKHNHRVVMALKVTYNKHNYSRGSCHKLFLSIQKVPFMASFYIFMDKVSHHSEDSGKGTFCQSKVEPKNRHDSWHNPIA